MRKLLAAILFLVACFIGAGTQTDLYGDISTILFIFILIIACGLGGFAIQLWKGTSSENDEEDENKKQEDQKNDSSMTIH